MASNPYATPEAPVADRSPQPFSFPASIVGALAGSGAAYILALLYGNVALWWLFSTGVSLDKLYHTAANSPLHNMVTHLTNVFAAAVGGYWAAKLGPGKPFVHAGVAGALMLVPVAIALLGPYEMPHPLWSLGLLFVTPIPSALLGGYWWQRRA